ncbi:hypothetical protein DPMN_023919, partial [Dreissena polymorpha]
FCFHERQPRTCGPRDRFFYRNRDIADGHPGGIFSLKLNESHQPVLNILTKCSRYGETSAKLLATLEPGQHLTQDTLDKLFLISHAQCKYLQDEYAAVLLNSQFDNSTSRLFRAVQKNTSWLNAESFGRNEEVTLSAS